MDGIVSAVVTHRRRKVSIDGLSSIVLPVVQINGAVLTSFLAYQVKNKGRGKSWHNENARAMHLLLEYWFATQGVFENPRVMFESFSEAVRYGTISVDGTDPTGLRWQPRSDQNANKIIKKITAYSDWLYFETDDESVLLNPLRTATPYEKMMSLAAYHHKKNNSFLKHTFDDKKAAKQAEHVRSVKGHQTSNIDPNSAKYKFPKDKTWELLEEGFTIYGSRPNDPLHKRVDLAKVLVVMLMRFTGLRISEVLNIYACDITVDPAKSCSEHEYPLVKVHHPADGIAPEYWRKKYNKPAATRAEYLSSKYGMLPRSDKSNPKRLYSGWKNPVLITDHKFMIAYFNNSQAAELFFIYWRLYRVHQAPRKQAHPFAFSNRKDGSPLSYKSVSDALQKAVERIGLVYRKEDGTTNHGFRHCMKDELDDAGTSPVFIKHVMHHANIDSQNEYGHKSPEEIHRELERAEGKLLTASKENQENKKISGRLKLLKENGNG